MAFKLRFPVRNTIANNSYIVNDSAPWGINRSLGLISSGSSCIVVFNNTWFSVIPSHPSTISIRGKCPNLTNLLVNRNQVSLYFFGKEKNVQFSLHVLSQIN